jgi:hypothetical protein
MEIWENRSLEDMEGEVWKDIKGYEGLYQVSNMGRVKSLERFVNSPMLKDGRKKIESKILKQFNNQQGYLKVHLYKESISKQLLVHRLVAIAYIDNPINKPTVDHLNTIRNDNRVCNLKWATFSEQSKENPITNRKIREAIARNNCANINKAIKSNEKKVRCITTGETFNSLKEASEYYNIDGSHICCCCKGKRKTSGKLNGQKLKWEYID